MFSDEHQHGGHARYHVSRPPSGDGRPLTHSLIAGVSPPAGPDFSKQSPSAPTSTNRIDINALQRNLGDRTSKGFLGLGRLLRLNHRQKHTIQAQAPQTPMARFNRITPCPVRNARAGRLLPVQAEVSPSHRCQRHHLADQCAQRPTDTNASASELPRSCRSNSFRS